MLTARTLALTVVALCAFAANSLLCRAALGAGHVDAVTFTTLRLVAGAAALAPFVWRSRKDAPATRPPLTSALALFAYAIAFSLAYRQLDAGAGALLLFGAVQVTMILGAVLRGERPRALEWLGLVVAGGGLLWLTLPRALASSTSLPPVGSALMALAGVAWGYYSLRGRALTCPPSTATAWSFLRSAPLALAASAIALLVDADGIHADAPGIALALTSGALTSGLGYIVWYAALRGHSATTAAVSQLTVPILAAGAGVAFLDESLNVRVVVAAVLIIGGVSLAIMARRRR